MRAMPVCTHTRAYTRMHLVHVAAHTRARASVEMFVNASHAAATVAAAVVVVFVVVVLVVSPYVGDIFIMPHRTSRPCHVASCLTNAVDVTRPGQRREIRDEIDSIEIARQSARPDAILDRSIIDNPALARRGNCE